MRAWQLSAFGVDHLSLQNLEDPPTPGPGEVLVRLQGASINPRDAQIIAGQFTDKLSFPMIPLSDGAGIVEACGDGVDRFAPGDLVAPTFFPDWLSGEATGDERKISTGLEAPGVLRDLAVLPEHALIKGAPHLSATELACYPCAGLTAWTSLVDKSAIGAGAWVLIQGTGGVAMAGLQFATALGANTVVLSSSDDRLAAARALGATETINYTQQPDWGEQAFALAGRGVDAVLEIGGAGTLPQSLAAIRHGGHINIIGYVAGAVLDITVFPLIIRNANLHGIGTGNRASFVAMMECVAQHELRPVIEKVYAFEDFPAALHDLNAGGHMGKRVIDFQL